MRFNKLNNVPQGANKDSGVKISQNFKIRVLVYPIKKDIKSLYTKFTNLESVQNTHLSSLKMDKSQISAPFHKILPASLR